MIAGMGSMAIGPSPPAAVASSSRDHSDSGRRSQRHGRSRAPPSALQTLPPAPAVDDAAAAVRVNRSARRDNSHSRSRSSSRDRSSSPSSDDAYTKNKRSIYYVGQRVKAKYQLHLVMIERMRARYQSFAAWYEDNKCKTVRNGFEAATLCAALDQQLIIRDGLALYELPSKVRDAVTVALEVLCRRLHGVMAADDDGNWDVATAIDLLGRRSLTNDRITRVINRDITAARAVKGKNGGNGNANRGGKGNNNKGAASSNDKAATK